MPKFYGKGKSAVKTFKDKIRDLSRAGRLSNISFNEKKQIVQRVEKLFTKNGKESNSIDLVKLQREVFNPLRIKPNDSRNSQEIGTVEKALGLDRTYTTQIGSEYSRVLRAEKKAEIQAQKKMQTAQVSKKTQQPLKPKKESNLYKFYDEFNKKRAEEEKKEKFQNTLKPGEQKNAETQKTEMLNKKGSEFDKKFDPKEAPEHKSGGKNREKIKYRGSIAAAGSTPLSMAQYDMLKTSRFGLLHDRNSSFGGATQDVSKYSDFKNDGVMDETSGDALTRFGKLGLDFKKQSSLNIPEKTSYSKEISDKLALAREAYGEDAAGPMNQVTPEAPVSENNINK